MIFTLRRVIQLALNDAQAVMRLQKSAPQVSRMPMIRRRQNRLSAQVCHRLVAHLESGILFSLSSTVNSADDTEEYGLLDVAGSRQFKTVYIHKYESPRLSSKYGSKWPSNAKLQPSLSLPKGFNKERIS